MKVLNCHLFALCWQVGVFLESAIIVSATPTGQQPSVGTSISDVAGLAALIIGIPAAAVAVIMLIHYIRRWRRGRKNRSDGGNVQSRTITDGGLEGDSRENDSPVFDGGGGSGLPRIPSRTFYPSWRHAENVDRVPRRDLLGDARDVRSVALMRGRRGEGVRQVDELPYPFVNEQRVWLEELENDPMRIGQHREGSRDVL